MKDIEEKVLLELVENDTLLNKYLKDTKIKKIIFVKNRLKYYSLDKSLPKFNRYSLDLLIVTVRIKNNLSYEEY